MIEGQEDVTWEDWVALADTCERCGIEALFRSDHYVSVFERGRARRARRLGHDQRARRAHDDAAARHDGLADELPPPVGAGQARHDRRPRLQRAHRARHGHRLVGGRAHRVRLPVPAHEGAHGRARGAARDRPRRPLEADGPFSFKGEHYTLEDLTARPLPLPAPAPAADHGRRRRPARGAARRPLRRRVQHGHADARRDPRAPREHRRGVREGRPRADPVLGDDHRRDRRRPGGVRRARARAQGLGGAGAEPGDDDRRHASSRCSRGCTSTRRRASSASSSSTSRTATSRWSS